MLPSLPPALHPLVVASLSLFPSIPSFNLPPASHTRSLPLQQLFASFSFFPPPSLSLSLSPASSVDAVLDHFSFPPSLFALCGSRIDLPLLLSLPLFPQLMCSCFLALPLALPDSREGGV